MNPISLTGGSFPSPYASMRPELAMRRVAGRPETGTPDPALESLGTPSQAPVEFNNVLGKFVQEVNTKQMAAGDAVTGLLSGQNVPLHQAMIAMEEASVSFQLMVEVRNKLLEGYQELIRMQV